MAKRTSGKAQPAQRSGPPSTEGGAGAVDSRVRRSRDRVLTTAFELLSEGGVGGFTVDEVARRSGVAKTTIYRHATRSIGASPQTNERRAGRRVAGEPVASEPKPTAIASRSAGRSRVAAARR